MSSQTAMPCAGCKHAVRWWGMEWCGTCGVQVVRYGCTEDPDACPYSDGGDT